MAEKTITGELTWPVFTDDSIEDFVGLPGMPIVDGRGGSRQLRICDGTTPGCHPITGGGAGGVATPTFLFPTQNAVVGSTPILQTSPFNGLTADMKGDSHAATFWQIATDPNFSNLVVNRRHDTANLTTLDVAAVEGPLPEAPGYYVRVAYIGTANVASHWSAPVLFDINNYVPDILMARPLPTDPENLVAYGEAFDLNADGTRVVIGDYRHSSPLNNAGAVYIFDLINGAWVQQAILRAPDAAATDYFGARVCLSEDGTRLLTSAYLNDDQGTNSGSAYTFKLVNGTWTFEEKLLPADVVANDRYGQHLAMSGDGNTIVVGADGDQSPSGTNGSVYIYTWNGSNWIQQAKYRAETVSTQFPYYVATNYDGTVVAAGGPGYGTDAINGQVHIYQYQNAAWQPEVVVEVPGANGDGLGVSLCFTADGNTMVVGDPYTDDNAGNVHWWTRENGVWSYDGKLGLHDVYINDNFGWSVDISANGEVIVVGAPYHDNAGPTSGAMLLYRKQGAAWVYAARYEPDRADNGWWCGAHVRVSADGFTSMMSSESTTVDPANPYTGAAYILK